MNDIFVYLARLENVDGREKLKHYHNFQLTNYLIIYFRPENNLGVAQQTKNYFNHVRGRLRYFYNILHLKKLFNHFRIK